MKNVGILFPHQLFEENVLFLKCDLIYLVEEALYFNQYNFHKQKIAFHRASMKFYENFLQVNNIEVVYIDCQNEIADIRKLVAYLSAKGVKALEYIDTTDYWLEHQIRKGCKDNGIEVIKNTTPGEET